MNTKTDAIIDIRLSPEPSRRHDLAEIAALALGFENSKQEYWAEELDNGRVYVETNPYDGEEWDVALSVFVAGRFIGDVLLRGADLKRAR